MHFMLYYEPGHAAMEAVVANLLEMGEVAMVCQNGIWGLRFADMVERNGTDYSIKQPANWSLNQAIYQDLITDQPSSTSESKHEQILNLRRNKPRH